MANLPTGTVTFFFTDIEGSTPLWEQHAHEMSSNSHFEKEWLNQGECSNSSPAAMKSKSAAQDLK